MLIAVFYQISLFIGDPILLGGLNLVDEILDLLGLGDIFIGLGVDGELILDCSHEC